MSELDRELDIDRAAVYNLVLVRQFDDIGQHLARITPYTNDTIKVGFPLPQGGNGLYEWSANPVLWRNSSAVVLGRLAVQYESKPQEHGISEQEYTFAYLVNSSRRHPDSLRWGHEAWINREVRVASQDADDSIDFSVSGTLAAIHSKADFDDLRGLLGTTGDALITAEAKAFLGELKTYRERVMERIIREQAA